jgi:hypothetical protein
MRIPDGAHTHGSADSGLGTALLVLAGAALAVKLAAPVAAAVGELVHVLLVLWPSWPGPRERGCSASARGACTAGATQARPAPQPSPPGVVRATRPLPPSHVRAIEAPKEVHLHFHGVTGEEIAAIIARHESE